MPASIEHNVGPTLGGCVRVPGAHEPAGENIIAALAEALFSGEHYELVDRDGELFVRPVACRGCTGSTMAVFSPDSRAQRDAFSMAA